MTTSELWAELSPDDKGSVAAVIQNAVSGEVLMLGYQNREAMERSLETGDVWFWSRSRRELWHKGATSGSYLRIAGPPRLDCDGDALLYPVMETGPVCHTGKCGCFHRPIDVSAAAAASVQAVAPGRAPAPSQAMEQSAALDLVPARLEGIIGQRAAAADPGDSYTARLLGAGLDKILKKIGEEATEVVLAAKNGDRANLIWELADLYYHAAVLMAAAGVSRRDVLAELARRFP